MSRVKHIIALIILYTKHLLNSGRLHFIAFFNRIYKPSYFDYVLLLFFHKYPARSYNSEHYKENVKRLLVKRECHWIRSTRDGKLFLVESKKTKRLLMLQNFLSLGAFRVRLERAIYLSTLALSLEFLNPFDRETFKSYFDRKLQLMQTLLDHLEWVNNKDFTKRKEIEYNIWLFKIGSYIQEKTIREMHQAVRRQKKPRIIEEAQEGLAAGLYPLLIPEGRSGAYWMRSKAKEVLGLFKPFDEEPFAINNPTRGAKITYLGDRKMRAGVRVGEAAHNEVAAFRVDRFFGFGIVPKTYYASFTHHVFFGMRDGSFQSFGAPKKKYGSFQEYIEGFVPFYSLAASEIPKIPQDEYQTLLFFDLLIGNSDRHLNNLLIGDEKIAAIDHGYSFPDRPTSLEVLIWGLQPHADALFHPEIKKLANDFPFERLSFCLRKNCFRSLASMDRMRERLALFRAAVNADLKIQEMGLLFNRENFKELEGLGLMLDKKADKVVKFYSQLNLN